MADDVIKRMNYFDRQFLRAKDFKDEQSYHLEHRRRHNRLLHTPGVALGLEVTGKTLLDSVTIGPGMAIDDEGREIVLPESRTIYMPQNITQGHVDIYLVYAEEATDERLEAGVQGATRWQEKYGVVVAPPAKEPEAGVPLARVYLNLQGQLTQDPFDKRTMSTTLPEELDVQKLRLKHSGSEETDDWPQLTASNPREATLQGKLVVEGENGEVSFVVKAGEVGIGTTSPTEKLEVVGTIKASDFVIIVDGEAYKASALIRIIHKLGDLNELTDKLKSLADNVDPLKTLADKAVDLGKLASLAGIAEFLGYLGTNEKNIKDLLKIHNP